MNNEKYLAVFRLNLIKQKADTLINLLSVSSDYLDENGLPLPFKVLVSIDDDKTSAYEAAYLYHWIFATHGYYPEVLAVGGRGMISRFFFQPEGKMLARTLRKLGAKKEHITIYCEGRNSGDNMMAIYGHMKERVNDPICFCLTKRLGLRTKLTQLWQAPLLNAYYNSIEEGSNTAPKWLNYKKLGNMKTYFEEIGAIYPTCVKYQGIFQVDIPIEIREKVADESSEYKEIIDFFTEKHNLRFTRGKSDKFAYVKLVIEFLFSIRKSRKENKLYIEKYKQRISEL